LSSSRQTRRSLLVTGAHRTGTGWVSRVLAKSPTALCYVWEPFSPKHRPGTLPIRFERYFQYVCAENSAGYPGPLADTIALRYRPLAELRSLRSPRDAGRMMRDWRIFARERRRGAAALLKDPIALFSSEWLADTFDLGVVVLIRHPAAFVASLKTRDWRHSFQSFLDQPLLMRDFLHPYEEEIRFYAQGGRDIVDASAVLWKVLYSAVERFQERRPDWIFVRLEDLSRNTLPAFRDLYGKLGLEWSEEVESFLRSTSDERNLAVDSDPGSVRRHSAAHSWSWKRQLTPEEVERIRTITDPLWKSFYSETDWGE
jgi:hypothetical protein